MFKILRRIVKYALLTIIAFIAVIALLIVYMNTAPFEITTRLGTDRLAAFATGFVAEDEYYNEADEVQYKVCKEVEDFQIPLGVSATLLFRKIDDDYRLPMAIIALKQYRCIIREYGLGYSIHGSSFMGYFIAPYTRAYVHIFGGFYRGEFISSNWVMYWLEQNMQFADHPEIKPIIADMCRYAAIRLENPNKRFCAKPYIQNLLGKG